MRTKPLKLWNGAGYCVVKSEELKKRGLRMDGVHVYAAAHSRADLMRMIAEYSGKDQARIGLNSYIKDYWSEGTSWGINMNGITPERGIWIIYTRAEGPVKVWPISEGTK